MKTTELLEALFARVEAGDGSDTRAFLKQFGRSPAAAEEPFERLVRVALHADRRSAAAAAGHQAAIRRMFPATPDDAVVAFCVSEDRGPHPAHILSSLTASGDDWLLNGSKKWGSLAPDADLLYVAASIGRQGERNDLRMIALPADRPGIDFDLEPYLEYGTEMRIAALGFDDVRVHAEEVLSGDAYLAYIKPFRLVEDVFTTAATQVAMIALGQRHGWPEERIEALVALVCQAAAVSSTAMAGPEEVLLLSAYLRASEQCWRTTWAEWPDVPPAVIERWSPGRELLEVARRAREVRRQRAWDELRSRHGPNA